MKKIPEITVPGAVPLTPMQMNAIHFDTGTHSSLAEETPASTASKADSIRQPASK